MNTLRNITILSLHFLMFISCKKNVETANSYGNRPSTLAEVFDVFWNKMNMNYVYWSIDQTDWSAVHKQYESLFDQLDLDDTLDVRRSVRYFREMTKSLIDGHYRITFQHSLLLDSLIYPSYDRKVAGPDFHNPYPYFSVDKQYFDTGYQQGYDYSINPSGIPLFCISAFIKSDILYFHCNYFYLLNSLQSPSGNDVWKVWNSFTQSLQTNSIRGVIIDLRGNSGGYINDLDFFTGNFITEPLPFGFTRYKKGNGNLDYTPWIEAFIKPKAKVAVTAPIVILGDHFSASLAETIILALGNLDRVVFVGEKTWGATGPLTAQEIYNSGQFKIEGFMSVETSSAMFKSYDGIIYEGEGITPDVVVPFNQEKLNIGIDPQLEKAISLVE